MREQSCTREPISTEPRFFLGEGDVLMAMAQVNRKQQEFCAKVPRPLVVAG